MTLDETIQHINNLSDLIAESIPDIAGVVAVSAKTLIQERIQETSLDANEQIYPAYSADYKKKRLKSGLSNPNVNMTFSGQMWRGIRPISEGTDANGYYVIIGGSNSDSSAKLSYMEARYTNVLKLSVSEEKKCAQIIDFELEKLIKKAGL
jgi:hypothetical protein